MRKPGRRVGERRGDGQKKRVEWRARKRKKMREIYL